MNYLAEDKCDDTSRASITVIQFEPSQGKIQMNFSAMVRLLSSLLLFSGAVVSTAAPCCSLLFRETTTSCEKAAGGDAGRWSAAWEEPQVLRLEDVIVPTTSCHGLQPLVTPSSPKNQSSGGKLNDEVIRQLAKAEAGYAESEPADDGEQQLPSWASSEYAIGHGDFAAFDAEACHEAASMAVPCCEFSSPSSGSSREHGSQPTATPTLPARAGRRRKRASRRRRAQRPPSHACPRSWTYQRSASPWATATSTTTARPGTSTVRVAEGPRRRKAADQGALRQDERDLNEAACW